MTCFDACPELAHLQEFLLVRADVVFNKHVLRELIPVCITIPPTLAELVVRHEREAGRAWLTRLPGLAADAVERWQLRLGGPPRHGMGALVQPVVCPDGTLAVLKLQLPTDENAGEALALRRWQGLGVVTLLDHDPATGALLLERLDAMRTLSTVSDDLTALQILSEMLARLVAVPAPEPMRRLSDIAGRMLDDVPQTAVHLAGTGARDLLLTCADAVREVVSEPGDRLLHWDLHYDNVLARRTSDGPDGWCAIDPCPLAGDPGFELLPAIWNRWDDVVASGDVARAVRRRFNLMIEIVGLDRQRAARWTLGRILQDALWNVADGERVFDPAREVIARVILEGLMDK